MTKILCCEKCGTSFECMRDSDTPCWCMELPISAIDSKILDCLCPDCLKIRV